MAPIKDPSAMSTQVFFVFNSVTPYGGRCGGVGSENTTSFADGVNFLTFMGVGFRQRQLGPKDFLV